MSLASKGELDEDDQIIIDWSTDGTKWNNITTLKQNEDYSNELNGGYCDFKIESIFTEKKINDLQIKLTHLSNNPKDERLPVFLDAIWLEIKKESNPDDKNKKFKIKLNGKDFLINEEPEFEIEEIKGSLETLANIPVILSNGSEWYKQLGTKNGAGTKIFALAGKVKNTGLVEVPMGTTLREIIFDIGGGIPGRREFKAAQMGGPSGGCVPEEHLDLPIDYESVKAVGAIMGSGGLIVMDNDTSMVDISKYFMEFVQEESCGKCVPCRVGTRKMLDILTKITKGEGCRSDIEDLKEMANVTQTASLCGLGQTAPNPVLSTIRYFMNEYEALIK